MSFDLVEKVWSEVQDKIDLTEQEIPGNARLELSRNSGPPISVLYSIQWKGNDEPPLILMSRLAEQLKENLHTWDPQKRLKFMEKLMRRLLLR